MKMNHTLLVLFALISGFIQLQAQDSTSVKTNNEAIIYTIGYNKIPDRCNVPLIGVINVAKGNYTGLQLGFTNSTADNFKGLEIGFANTVGKNSHGGQIGFFNTTGNSSNSLTVGFFNTIGNKGSGAQIGFFNTLADSFHGLHVGFFNTIGSSADGIQIGFFNTLGKSFNGLQVGFFNTSGKSTNGLQVGFFNTTGKSMEGFQIGFSNIVGKDAKGFQIGGFNLTPELSGLELGFVNVVDTVKKGVPVGFLSIVKRGGYQTLEVGSSEMFPVNISYKTGIRQFYTSLVASYSTISYDHYYIGIGIGSVMPINKTLSFNPEIISQTTCTSSWDQVYSLHLNMNYKLSDRFCLVAGPSLVWNHLNDGTISHKSVFSIYNRELNTRNRLLIGLNVAVRYQFGK
jgi:hypothetical protein